MNPERSVTAVVVAIATPIDPRVTLDAIGNLRVAAF
jgi:hypothetical protein